MKNVITIFFFVILFTAGSIYAQENNSSVPQVKIAGTQLLNIHSSIVEQEYNLYINLPASFNDTSKSFPVIYLLDAQWDFPLLNAIYGEQFYDGFIPDAIIVGITWGGTNPDYDFLRAGDFAPTKTVQQPNGGGAKKFLSFIKEELIPFIDSKFKTNPNNRTLVGSSLGGLFTLYTMFHETELFNNYVCTSPVVGWDNGILYTYEKEYSEQHTSLPVRLSMAIGGCENVPIFQKFVDKLREYNFKDLQLKTLVLEGIGHSGGKAEGYTRGLQFAFEKKPVDVDAEILKTYTGTYEITSGFRINIVIKDDHLVAEIPGNNEITFYALNEKDFYTIGQYLYAHFIKDTDGKVTGFQLEQYSGKNFVKKIN